MKEALFLKKKLITNNIALKNEWFYDEPNMFILGIDRRNVYEFVKGDYIDNKLNLDELNFSYWISRF